MLDLSGEEFKMTTAKSPQSCPTPSDPMDCSPPDSSIHGIFQARGLEWVVIDFSMATNAWQTVGAQEMFVLILV